MGKLIVIEGLDGAGKTTQTAIVAEELRREGRDVRVISFPDYKSESAALVNMYLRGEFGGKPENVNAYAASSFYAVDRYSSYIKEWKEFYEQPDSFHFHQKLYKCPCHLLKRKGYHSHIRLMPNSQT